MARTEVNPEVIDKSTAGDDSSDWPVLAFFALAYLIAWGLFPVLDAIASASDIPNTLELASAAEILQFGDMGDQLVVPGWFVYLITRVQDFAFTIAGIIMTALVGGRVGLGILGWRGIKWRVPLRWYLFAFLPWGLYALAAAVAILSDPQILDTFTINSSTVLTILFGIEAGFFVYLLTRGALGEEPGLRGFALPRFQTRHGPFWASVVIGLLWAGWHLPVLIGRDPATFVAFILLAFFLSFIFTWLFNNSLGSLIPVMIFHTTQNSEEVFEVLLPGLIGTDWELVSSLLLLVIGVIIAVIVWRQARSWPSSFKLLSGDSKQYPTT